MYYQKPFDAITLICLYKGDINCYERRDIMRDERAAACSGPGPLGRPQDPRIEYWIKP